MNSMITIMGVNLKEIFLVKYFQARILKKLSFLVLFLFFFVNAYGQVPSGYSVTIDQDPINAGNETAVSFSFTGAHVGAA